jgi:hypothetical protein
MGSRNSAIIFFLLALAAGAKPQVRCRNFLVNPSTGPVGEIDVRADEAWSGKLSVTPPEGWSIEPAAFDVALAAKACRLFSYRVVKARENAENAYAFTLAVAGCGVRTQIVRTASAPYGKPKTDGKLGDEWRDAIPIHFVTQGKRTVVRAYWNEVFFHVAVEVEEQALVPSGKKREDGAFDAAQLFIGPKGATTNRHEFLVEPAGKSRATCRRLAALGAPSGSEAGGVPGATAAARHDGGVTVYEVALPLEAIDGVRADAGREFAFSVLVHDPDGTGLRDLGAAMGRPEAERRARPACWTLWAGGCWAGAMPFDGGSEFGFCSSVH